MLLVRKAKMSYVTSSYSEPGEPDYAPITFTFNIFHKNVKFSGGPIQF